MDIGLLLNITTETGQSDASSIANHLALGDKAEDYGFKSLFVLEHHFSNYVLSPDPFQVLSYFAGRTRHLLLGTSVLVLPWHHPVRLAEQISLLNVISGGRCSFGFGRGAGTKEFAGYNVPISESASRFVESVEIIQGFLRQGTFSYTGLHYQIPELAIKPRPDPRILERLYGSAGSHPSIERIAMLGLGMMVSVQREWNLLPVDIAKFNSIAMANGHPIKRPILSIVLFVHESRSEAIEKAAEYLDNDLRDLDAHYQYSSGSLSHQSSYEHYKGTESYFSSFLQASAKTVSENIEIQIIGSPEDCVQKIIYLKKLTNFAQLLIEFCFGRMPIDVALNNMETFSQKVLPRLAKHEI